MTHKPPYVFRIESIEDSKVVAFLLSDSSQKIEFDNRLLAESVRRKIGVGTVFAANAFRTDLGRFCFSKIRFLYYEA